MKTIFRAKEKNTDNYIIGYEYYNHIEDEYYITHYITGNNYKVDKSTRSINFEDMLDSQGNKIFASLQEDGKGGDVITYDEDIRIIAIYKNGTFIFKDSMNLAIVPSSRYLRTKVIGIQE